MKRRVWKILAVDLAAGAVFGCVVLSGGGASPTVVAPSPAPSWGLFSPAQWQTVSGRLARRGFEPASIRVVGGMLLPQDRPFVFVAGTTGGRLCVVPVRGVHLGPTTCHAGKALVLFRSPGTMRGVLGLVGRGVVGLSATDREGRVIGLPLIRVGGMLTFADDVTDAVSLRAYRADGRVLARIDLGA
jgi:hypothetical protein